MLQRFMWPLKYFIALGVNLSNNKIKKAQQQQQQ